MDDILFTMLNASFLIAIWIAVFILIHSYISMYNEELSESRSRRLRRESNALKQDFETLKQAFGTLKQAFETLKQDLKK